MSITNIIETTKSIAISNKLNSTEISIYNYICREYSKTFHTPLKEVFKLDPEFVCLHFYEERMSELDKNENIEDLIDLINSLKDPNYDIEKERKMREELFKIEKEEEERVRQHRPVHESLESQKTHQIDNFSASNKPKSGGINMDLISQLEKEGK